MVFIKVSLLPNSNTGSSLLNISGSTFTYSILVPVTSYFGREMLGLKFVEGAISWKIWPYVIYWQMVGNSNLVLNDIICIINLKKQCLNILIDYFSQNNFVYWWNFMLADTNSMHYSLFVISCFTFSITQLWSHVYQTTRGLRKQVSPPMWLMWNPPMTSLKVGKFESFSPPPSPPLSHLSILKSLFFSLDLSENTDMDKDTMEDDEFQGMYSNFAYNFFIFNNVHSITSQI